MANSPGKIAAIVSACLLLCFNTTGCQKSAANNDRQVADNQAAVAAEMISASQKKDVFSSVPKSIRPNLIARLDAVINYRRTQQWDKLYDLLYDTHQLSKEEYVRQQQAFKTQMVGPIEFNPDEVTFFEQEGDWMISGCGVWRKNGRDRYLGTSVYAKSLNGEWYFTEVNLILKQFPDDPSPCTQAHD